MPGCETASGSEPEVGCSVVDLFLGQTQDNPAFGRQDHRDVVLPVMKVLRCDTANAYVPEHADVVGVDSPGLLVHADAIATPEPGVGVQHRDRV